MFSSDGGRPGDGNQDRGKHPGLSEAAWADAGAVSGDAGGIHWCGV